jgi:hypothetical protein
LDPPSLHPVQNRNSDVKKLAIRTHGTVIGLTIFATPQAF